MNDVKIDLPQAKKLSTFQHLSAGACAGLLADLCTHPIDTIRARLQVQRNTGSGAYKNTADALISTIKNEGWTALYKGFPIVGVATVPAHAFYFAGYEMVKNSLEPTKSDDQKSMWVHFVAGLWAECCGAIIWTPMDVCKQRMQIQNSNSDQPMKYKSSFNAFGTILKEEGFRGIYKGYRAALATYGPFVGIYFVGYEQSKRFYQRILGINPKDKLPTFAYAVSGAQAGAFAAAITCPMDVIKTRMQVQNTLEGGDKYKGVIDAISRIAKEEGTGAFTKGLAARILWIAPGTAITICAC